MYFYSGVDVSHKFYEGVEDYNGTFGDPSPGEVKFMKRIIGDRITYFLENTPLYSKDKYQTVLCSSLENVRKSPQEISAWITYYLFEGVEHIFLKEGSEEIAKNFYGRVTVFTSSLLEISETIILYVPVGEYPSLSEVKNVYGSFWKRINFENLNTYFLLSDKKVSHKPFDWIAYILNYPDLWFIKDRTSAVSHYYSTGRAEGRTYFLLQKKTGNFLRCMTSGGLVNQLVALFHSLILGHYTGKNVCFSGFRKHHSKNDFIPWEEVLDIGELEKLLHKYGLRSSLVQKEEEFLPSFYQGWDGSYVPRGNVIDFFVHLCREKGSRDLGSPFLAYEPHSRSDHNSFFTIHDLIFSLVGEVTFAPLFYQLADKYSPPGPFTAVHLRLEDDMLLHPKTRAYHMAYLYEQWIEENVEGSLYLATYLTKEENMFNYVAEKYKETSFMAPLDLGLPSGRELNAVVDLIICSRADNFLGFHVSSFSQAIARRRKNSLLPYEFIQVNGDNLWLSSDFY